MRDVSIVATIYCLLFIVLTTPTGVSYGSFSTDVSDGIHHFLADLIFWAAALYICASGTAENDLKIAKDIEVVSK